MAPLILLLGTSMVASACMQLDREPEPGASATVTLPIPSPTSQPSAAPAPWPDLTPDAPLTEISPAELMPFGGAPPVWPLASRKTDRIMRGLYQLLEGHWQHFAPVDRRCAGLPRMRPSLQWEGRIGGNQAVEACLRPYLDQLGVGEEALDLFFATGIVIQESIPAGPFWIGRGYDYDMYGSNGWPPDYLFTDAGILDLQEQRFRDWRPLEAAWTRAMHAPLSRRVREAYAEESGGKPKDVGFWNYGESMALAARPQKFDGGWSVPLLWSLLGCHACSMPIAGIFSIDITRGGIPIDIRFIDLCKDTAYAPNDTSDISPEQDFGVPPCPGMDTNET